MNSSAQRKSSISKKFEKMSINSKPLAFVNKDIADYFANKPSEECKPWMLKPETPSSQEIMGADDEYVDLAPNKIDAPWDSKEKYLETHYELLREDAIAPLRDAVAFVRNDPEMMDNQKVSIYEKVYVTGITFAHRGLAFRIRFSTNRAGKNIHWDYSKRLISGSVVALSPANDSFQSKCVIAVVAARPLEKVKMHPPEIDVFVAQSEDANFDPQLEWIMVEAKDGYYESVRHTMAALQKMSRERFPLSEHICSLDPNVDVPQYVNDHPVVDLVSITDDQVGEAKVDLLNGWPTSPLGNLDDTQWAALEQILTRRLAVIQGPPGTGKTFVSVAALRILLSNMDAGDPPIIIASQTNHALDQILKQVSQFEEKYVRIGARSSDPDIKKRTLFAIREKEPMPIIHGNTFPSVKKYSKLLTNSISELLQPFNDGNSDNPLPSSIFAKHNLLTQTQYESLKKGAQRWVCAGDEADETDPLIVWLGDQTAEFEVVYTAENFGFAEDEIDLEYEQLKELEAEQGIDEDDYETLKGQFVSLREGCFGKSPSSPHTTGVEFLKEEDMWKIPVKNRGSVYNTLRKQLKQKVLQEFHQFHAKYSENCRLLQIGKWEKDDFILQNAKVIGMTATGLSKYRGLISSIKPRIVLIEEAAEAIEAPIAAACFDSLQQLILVGDHQQLRGHCSVRELEGEPFFLGISMFERLVRNNIKYVTLLRQRRMVPEIRQLLEPIYGTLKDHKSVQRHAKVNGMGDLRMFFFSHDWPESVDSFASKFNEKEAAMIVEFYVYLIFNDVPVKDITILTFYNGQRKKLLRLLKDHPYLQGQYVKVVTVDSYQGEENEVVILSLVRNGKQNIGFLSIENRVCVALSRARRGFYLFGNAESLAAANPLWYKVLHVMGNKNAEPKAHLTGVGLPVGVKGRVVKSWIVDTNAHFNATTSHTTKCNALKFVTVRCCEESMRLEYMKEKFGAEDPQVYSEVLHKQRSPQETAIQNYQAFAKGGSKVQDAFLAQKAEFFQRQGDPTFGNLAGESGLDWTPRQVSLTANYAQGAKAHQQEADISETKQPQMNLLD